MNIQKVLVLYICAAYLCANHEAQRLFLMFTGPQISSCVKMSLEVGANFPDLKTYDQESLIYLYSAT